MPTNKDTDVTNQSAVKASQAITVLLTGKDSIFYYEGQPNYKDYKTLKVTSYKPDGLRGFLLKRNVEAVAKISDLKLKKLNRQISEIDFTKQVSEIKNGKKTPTVIIKATDQATYKNLIDALDEMSICSIGKYVIDKITPGDKLLIKNSHSKSDSSSSIAK